VSANDALIAAARQRAEGVVTAAQRAWFATGRRVVEAELEALG
jgi:protein-disulfide isomerase-like protein with CxxC motif